jgi:hypothetical protein
MIIDLKNIILLTIKNKIKNTNIINFIVSKIVLSVVI